MEQAIISASTAFGFDFYRATLVREEAGNTLISPLSIYLALAMLYNGAEGATREEMDRALRLNGMPLDRMNELCGSLIRRLGEADPVVKLSIANSIWYATRWPEPLTTFVEAVRDVLQGEVQGLDFSDGGAADVVNDWVSQHTEGKINKILERTNKDDLICLVNAIYFHGPWLFPFQEWKTSDGDFLLRDGRTVKVPFMEKTDDMACYRGQDMILVELTYGEERSFGLYAILPVDAGLPMSDFLGSFDESRLSTAIGSVRDEYCRLEIPKWEYEYTVSDMRPQLEAMGLGGIFEEPDLSRMYPSDLPVKLSQSIHKTYISVNEEGTEAAAVTAMVVAAGAMPFSRKEPPVVRFDRPFLYLIMEKGGGAILFMGVVETP